jgi:hypothetical protein
MRAVIILGSICAASGALLAQGGPGPGGGTSGGTLKQVSFFVPNETAPPGGVVQMKFMVTEPTPISTGRPIGSYDSATFDGIWGIELFNPGGDVNGVAVIDQSRVAIQYITSSGAQGTDYPVMTMALHVRPDAVPGTQTPFSLDSSSTWTLGLSGATTLKPVPPATVTVGGSISITNVVPGGGMVPAGTVVSINGLGFQAKTQVQLNAIQFSSIHVISPNEIQFTVAQDTNMTGQKIQVVNPDGSHDTYFSYMRGVTLGQSNQPLLANAVPIFSSVTHSWAVFAPMQSVSRSGFTGLAMQNPHLDPATITISMFSSTNALLGSSTLMLPGGTRVMREISELSQGAAPVFGSYVVIASSLPVQVFGFAADPGAGVIMPFAAVLAQ